MGLRFSIRKHLFRQSSELELDEEIQSHLRMSVDRKIIEGADPEQAYVDALREFGGIEQAKELSRESWGLSAMRGLLRDLQFSARSLARAPVFYLGVVAILAICIGLNATVLNALYAVVLRPLPFNNPDTLVHVANVGRNNPVGTGASGSSWVQYEDFRSKATLFDAFALSRKVTKAIESNGSTSNVDGRGVSADFFDTIGVKPLVGRFFDVAEVEPVPSNLIVLSEAWWH